MPSFEAQRDAWRRIPVDDLDYIDSRLLLQMPDHDFALLVLAAGRARYEGWRNWNNRWVDLLALQDPGRSVLDFGCGLGLDAAMMAANGNCVSLADVNSDSIALATRVLKMAHHEPCGAALIRGRWPFVDPGIPIDTFYASGVLHHIPHADEVVRRAAELVGPGGHLRAMLYGEAAREPWTTDQDFVRAMDAVGEYATWYNAAKIRRAWGAWWELDYCEPITEDAGYLAVHMVAR